MLTNLPFEVVNNVLLTKWNGVGGSNLYLVHTLPEWKAVYELLMKQQLVACDTESTGFYWYAGDRVCGLSFGWKDFHFYVPVRHKASYQAGEPPDQINIADIKDDLIAFFADTKRTTIWHNAKFDMHFYKREGIDIHCTIHDTRILWHFFDEDAPGALKTIASGWKDTLGREHPGIVDGAANIKEKELDDWRNKEAKLRREAFRKLVMAEADLLGRSIAHQDKNRNQLKKWISENVLQHHELAKNSKEDIDYAYIPVQLMTEYAALDTFLTYKVYEYTVKNIKWTAALSALYRNEMGLLRALYEAEEHGVKIKREFLFLAGEEFEKQIIELHAKVRLELGEINLNSTNQLADALLDKGVSLTRLTDASQKELDADPGATQKFAVDKKVLEKLKGKHDVIKDILKLREASKLKGTYVDSILAKIGDDDILHCSFNQNVRTGRMSSSDPNLQNIPARDKTIRKSFTVPNDEYAYLLADYSQIEVRLTAHYSQDPLLLDAYAKGQDIHTRTFCEMFGHTIEFAQAVLADSSHPQHEEFSLFRTVAKRINFGIIYGVGAPGLSEQIDRPDKYKNCSEKEWINVCQGFIDQYLDKYVGVKRFVNQGNRLVAKNAEVVNFFGRVRHLPHAHATKILKNDKLYWMEKRAQRQGVNFLIQGTAADLFKISAVRVAKILKGKKSKLVNFVHDEIQVYLHRDELDLIAPVQHAMEDWHFTVPITAEFSWSPSSWGEKLSITKHPINFPPKLITL